MSTITETRTIFQDPPQPQPQLKFKNKEAKEDREQFVKRILTADVPKRTRKFYCFPFCVLSCTC